MQIFGFVEAWLFLLVHHRPSLSMPILWMWGISEKCSLRPTWNRWCPYFSLISNEILTFVNIFGEKCVIFGDFIEITNLRDFSAFSYNKPTWIQRNDQKCPFLRFNNFPKRKLEKQNYLVLTLHISLFLSQNVFIAPQSGKRFVFILNTKSRIYFYYPRAGVKKPPQPK